MPKIRREKGGGSVCTTDIHTKKWEAEMQTGCNTKNNGVD